MRLRGAETILAVDDDPGILEFVAQILQSQGYRVLLAANGEKAMEIAAARHDTIDLLVTDVMLPGIKGQELAAQMKEECPGMNVLFMSGYLCPSMARSKTERGFEAFLQKPFTSNAMLKKIRKLLD